MYTICNCTRTLELWEWGRERDFQPWVPIIRLRQKRGHGALRRWEDVKRAAIPGYIFVPSAELRDFRAAAPFSFQLRVLGYRENGQPYECSLEELRTMQRLLNEEMRKSTKIEEEISLTVGQKVEIIHGVFLGHKARIERLLRNAVRIRLENGVFLTLPAFAVK